MSTEAPERPAANPPANSGNATKKGGRGKPRQVQTFTQEDMQISWPQTIEEKAAYKRRRAERDPLQKQVDALVLEAYRRWLKVGKPRKFVDMPLAVWTVRKQLEDDARFLLSKGATLIQRQLRYGHCPEHKVSGKTVVDLAFYVTDRHVDVEGAPETNGGNEEHSEEASE